MSGTNARLIEEAQRIADLCPRSDASAAFTGLIAALEAATAYEMFAVLGTDKDGDDWITDEKYGDIESAQAYSKRFGGTVHHCSVGEWIKAAK